VINLTTEQNNKFTVPDLIALKAAFWRYDSAVKIHKSRYKKKIYKKKTDSASRILSVEKTYFGNGEALSLDWIDLRRRMQRFINPPMNGLNQSKREREIIVSLTTYPQRIETVWLVLKKCSARRINLTVLCYIWPKNNFLSACCRIGLRFISVLG